jgi:hypothetical protein
MKGETTIPGVGNLDSIKDIQRNINEAGLEIDSKDVVASNNLTGK